VSLTQPSYKLKLEWAEKHLTSINYELNRYLRREPCRTVGEFEPDGTHYVCRFWVDAQPPEDLPLLIGDFLTNLRAVLDHLIAHLSTKHGKVPNDVAWPFCGSPKEFFRADPPGSGKWDKSSGMYRIRLISEAHQAHVQALQPYITKEAPNSTLGVLNSFCNRDKHRSIRTVATQFFGAGWNFKPPVSIFPELEYFEGPYEHKDKMARFKITRDPNIDEPVKGSLGTVVAFRDTPGTLMLVGPMLALMLHTVRNEVLPLFGA
jgi:hypothetical protein